ncbi:MAG: hypothetical protein WC832_02095 [Anaerolineales bacterium]
MTNMFSIILVTIKTMIVIVPILGILIFAGWIIIAIFIAKNGKKLMARFINNSGLPHGVRDPWPPRPHNSDR